jgi:integrase
MPSIRLKFRPSTITGKEGLLLFQLTHKRTVRQISTGYRIMPDEWDASAAAIGTTKDAKRNEALTKITGLLNRDRERLQRIVHNFETDCLEYHADDIVAEYKRVVRTDTLFTFMEKVITQHRMQCNVRAAASYRSALNSFMNYRQRRDILLDALSGEELTLYEAWLKQRGVCRNTSSFYMRILRATYNRAVDKGMLPQRMPFRQVYTGVSKTAKRAISLEYIRKIKELDLTEAHPSLSWARDIFMLSFYTRGMTFVDLAYLRKQDVVNDTIEYHRKKTGQLITIKLEPCALDIIKCNPNSDTDYLLPIITRVGCEYEQYRNALHRINDRLKKIGEMIGAPIKITSYVGRHSWTNAANVSEIPITVISESLGHSDLKTTQIYLASLDTSVIDSANAKILNLL